MLPLIFVPFPVSFGQSQVFLDWEKREERDFYLLGLHPVVPVPSSCMFETPIMIAPASRSFLATVASSVSGCVPRYTVPTR